MAGQQTRNQIPAPGAMVSPQGPGMTPDRTIVPGHVGFQHPAATEKRRPLTQYGSAEEVMGVFRRKPGDEMQASDFEQAPASGEEMRAANPALLTPVRPLDRAPSPAAQLQGGEVVRELMTEHTPENTRVHAAPTEAANTVATTGSVATSEATNPGSTV